MDRTENGIDYYALGASVRAAREGKGLTQEKLAELCSLSTAHIGHIERGTRIPSLDVVFRLASVLEVSTDTLLLGSFKEGDYFKHLSASLHGKDPKKIGHFIAIVDILAQKFDEL